MEGIESRGRGVEGETLEERDGGRGDREWVERVEGWRGRLWRES